MNATLIIGMFLSLFAFQSGFPFDWIPNYQKLAKPQFRSIPVRQSQDSYSFRFRDLQFVITVDGAMEKQPLISISRGSALLTSHAIGTAYLTNPDVRSFDADQNGIADLFIAYPYGPSGRNSSIQIIDSFFFFADSTYKFQELSSFYGSYELFRDFNNDGCMDFACFRFDQSQTIECSYLNVFSMTNGEFKNITESISGFPLFLDSRGTGKPRLLKRVPVFLETKWKARKPAVRDH